MEGGLGWTKEAMLHYVLILQQHTQSGCMLQPALQQRVVDGHKGPLNHTITFNGIYKENKTSEYQMSVKSGEMYSISPSEELCTLEKSRKSKCVWIEAIYKTGPKQVLFKI